MAALSKRAVQARLFAGAPRCQVGDVVRLREYPEEVNIVRECDAHGPTVLTKGGELAAWCFGDIETSWETVPMGEE